MKTPRTLLLAALLAAAHGHAAPGDDDALQQLISTYQQAAAQGDAKTVAAITHIPPNILAQKSEAEARAMVESFLSAGFGNNGGGRFNDTFTITGIDYLDNDTRAIVHGTAQTRDGQNLNVRWKAVKHDSHGWQYDGMELVE
ncbi:MAG: hypothetical protein Q4D61_07550 [Cardiobacteriaceae bacterium]|nr:hypothetical protein [Cardiobacteriaceae bacterium]